MPFLSHAKYVPKISGDNFDCTLENDQCEIFSIYLFEFVYLYIKCGVCVNKYKLSKYYFAENALLLIFMCFSYFFIVKSLICAFVCLFAAANQGRTAQVCLLLKHKANHHIRNIEGRTALDIAVQKADADVVTLLRLAALNEEIRENDMSGSSESELNRLV